MSGPDGFEMCQLCEEQIRPDDPVSPSLFNGRQVHHECGFRAVAGGVNHILGICTCCGGTLPPDPPGYTKREAAKLALAAQLVIDLTKDPNK